jgi:hypothetical protein
MDLDLEPGILHTAERGGERVVYPSIFVYFLKVLSVKL